MNNVEEPAESADWNEVGVSLITAICAVVYKGLRVRLNDLLRR